MKYVLYIDYVGSSGVEYRPLIAKNLAAAILESDAIYNGGTMYLLRVMEKTGRGYKFDKGVRSQDYAGVIEKRVDIWRGCQDVHIVSHDIAKWGDWYRLK